MDVIKGPLSLEAECRYWGTFAETMPEIMSSGGVQLAVPSAEKSIMVRVDHTGRHAKLHLLHSTPKEEVSSPYMSIEYFPDCSGSNL